MCIRDRLYGRSDSPLAGTDPEFAAIKTRLIYGEVYAEEKLSAKLRELVILVVATTNQTMDEVKRHTAAALAAGVRPEEVREAVYHCCLLYTSSIASFIVIIITKKISIYNKFFWFNLKNFQTA